MDHVHFISSILKKIGLNILLHFFKYVLWPSMLFIPKWGTHESSSSVTIYKLVKLKSKVVHNTVCARHVCKLFETCCQPAAAVTPGCTHQDR
jgi:hypothetical protein